MSSSGIREHIRIINIKKTSEVSYTKSTKMLNNVSLKYSNVTRKKSPIKINNNI